MVSNLSGTLIHDHDNKLSKVVLRKLHQDVLSFYTERPSADHLATENLLTFHFSLCLPKTNFWNEVLKRKIDQLLQSGIAQWIEDKKFVATQKANKAVVSDDNAEVLTLEHFELCFVFIVVMLGLSIVVFVVECLVGYFSGRCRDNKA